MYSKAAPGSATNTRRRPDPQHWLRSVRAVTQPSNERWLPVVGFEGTHEVSNCGLVRSIDRKTWERRRQCYRSYRGRVLATHSHPSGHLYVNLTVDGKGNTKQVHRLVLEAFVGPCPPGHECCHWDDDPTNNHLSNLRWGTRSDNAYDKVRNGNHHNARRTHCRRGHLLNDANTRLTRRPDGGVGRRCKTCANAMQRVAYAKAKAETPPPEISPDL